MEGTAADCAVAALVKKSAQFVAEKAKSVKIDAQGLDEFVGSFNAESFALLTEQQQYPLKFSLRSRVNFECTKDVLEFGSGFRLLLKACNGRGAHETILGGVFAMYIGSGDITASSLAGLSLYDVAELFQVQLRVEVPVGDSGVMTKEIDSPLRTFAEMIQRVLNDCGRILQAKKCADFFELIVRDLKPTKENPIKARELLPMLSTYFPAFNDCANYGGEKVFILKKAQLLASDLYDSVGNEHGEWKVEGVDDLTIFSDNVIPCVLRHMGVLKLDKALADKIDAAKFLHSGDDEVELRLVAVHACELLVEKLKDRGVTARALDHYLWRLGKEEKFRPLHRHYTVDTVFY